MLLCRLRMAAEAALLVVGWVRRIATISRRMAVAAFLRYLFLRDCCPYRLFRAPRRFGWLGWLGLLYHSISSPPYYTIWSSSFHGTKRIFGLVRTPSPVLACLGNRSSIFEAIGVTPAKTAVAEPAGEAHKAKSGQEHLPEPRAPQILNDAP